MSEESESSEEVVIEEANEVTDELVAAWSRLLPQVSSSAEPLSHKELEEIVNSPTTTLFMARVGGRYVGSLTLVTFRIPDGKRSWIEDVVVDEEERGKGIGDALNRAAIEKAQRVGTRSIDLTSNPKREAANKLYQRLGFKVRETNIYRYDPA